MLDFGFYNMDCMDGMKEFPDKYFDLAIVDPPYGINVGHTVMVGRGGADRPFKGNYSHVWGQHKSISKAKFYHPFDDSHPPDEGYFRELERVSKQRIIWGGNFMLEYLGNASCIIVWDKKRRGMDQADCEIAWTNLKGQSRIFEFRWNGMLQEDMKNKEHRIHPTQKPVALYKWLLANYAKAGDKILDTHVGSASSLVACRESGFKYVGFELDAEYYKMAKKRLDAAEAQMNIFDFMEGAGNIGQD
jgi:site-specific DNA-methyltransferase (adenine-specific)